MTHTLSHFCFLILLAAATFRLDDRSHVITSTPRLFNTTYDDGDDDRLREDVDFALKDTFRPANILFTQVQICLMFWVFGTTLYSSACCHFSAVRYHLLLLVQSFIMNLRLSFSANHFLHRPFPFLPD